jgi:rubredoxin
MDERLRELARQYDSSGEGRDRFFIAMCRAGHAEPAAIELLARLGYSPAVEFHYQGGGKKLQSHAFTSKFVKTVHQLLLIRMIGAMLLSELTEIFGTKEYPNDWYTPEIREYTGASPETIKDAFWQLVSPLLHAPLKFEYPIGERVYSVSWGNYPEVPLPAYSDFFNDASIARKDLRNVEMARPQLLLLQLISYFATDGGKRAFWNIFNPRRSLVAPSNMVDMYNDRGWNPLSWSPHMEGSLIDSVIRLTLLDGYSVQGKDRRTRYTRAADERRAKIQQQGTVEGRYYGYNDPKTPEKMTFHKGQWISTSSLKSKTLPKPEIILRDIKQVFDENSIKTYPYNAKHDDLYEYGEVSANNKLKVQRSIYLVLGRNISNSRANASKKAQDAGFIGATKAKIVTAWTGITTSQDLKQIAPLLEAVHGVDRVMISTGSVKWQCPVCDWSYSGYISHKMTPGARPWHEINDPECRNKRGWKDKYRGYGY